MSWLVDNLSQTLKRSMDLRLERQNLISANLANVDTPSYQPVELSFQETLEAELQGQDAPEAEVVYDPTVTQGADGNGVDLDREMGRLASNSLMYGVSTRIQRSRASILRYAITEGGR
jgi:flagellar basal-body rod protein FlgB